MAASPRPRRQARYTLHRGDVLDAYREWPEPDTIIVDGPYGVGGFHGDPRTPETLAEMYEPHVDFWSKCAKPATTLWFWGTEIGWATVHPVLAANGWDYVQAIHWDKGIQHVAGNVNGNTIRRFPIANEICVFYSRALTFPTQDGVLSAQQWLRYEWKRAGLNLNEANRACGVANAATRKYLTQDWLWYFPPAEMMGRLVRYANQRGIRGGRPYFSLDGVKPVTEEQWAKLRYTWTHQHAMTNVWSHPPLHSSERIRNLDGRRHAPRVYNPTAGVASAHLNQKPLELMRRILVACTQPGDIVWEPFGGLASASVASLMLGRTPYAAEIDPVFADLAETRLKATRKLRQSSS